MVMVKYIRLSANIFAFVFSLTVLASCSFPVKEENRDRDSTYRGFWSIVISETPSSSLTGSSSIKCWNMDGVGNLQIAGGRVVARVERYDLAGFINADGRFTAEIGLSGPWRFKLDGQLDSDTGLGEGRLTHNRKTEGLTGCASKVKFKKEDL